MFQWFAWHLELIFVLWTNSKLFLGEFEKAIFQVVARHSELLLSLLNSPNWDLGEVEKPMFPEVTKSRNSFSAS